MYLSLSSVETKRCGLLQMSQYVWQCCLPWGSLIYSVSIFALPSQFCFYCSLKLSLGFYWEINLRWYERKETPIMLYTNICAALSEMSWIIFQLLLRNMTCCLTVRFVQFLLVLNLLEHLFSNDCWLSWPFPTLASRQVPFWFQSTNFPGVMQMSMHVCDWVKMGTFTEDKYFIPSEILSRQLCILVYSEG